MNTSNIKDTLTTYAAIAFGTAMTVIGLPSAITAVAPTVVFSLPPVVNIICGIIIAVSIVITQVLNGKNPDGSTKTATQIIELNTKAEVTKDVVVTATTLAAINNNIATVTPPAMQAAQSPKV